MADVTLTKAAPLSQGGDDTPLYAVVGMDVDGAPGQGRAWARSALPDLQEMGFPVGDSDRSDALFEVLAEAAESPSVKGWPLRFGVLTLGFVDVTVVHVRGVAATGDVDSALRELVVAGAEPTDVVVEELTSDTGFRILTGIHHRVIQPDERTERLVLLAFVATRHERPEGAFDVVAFSVGDDASALLRTMPAIGGLVSSDLISSALA